MFYEVSYCAENTLSLRPVQCIQSYNQRAEPSANTAPGQEMVCQTSYHHHRHHHDEVLFYPKLITVLSVKMVSINILLSDCQAALSHRAALMQVFFLKMADVVSSGEGHALPGSPQRPQVHRGPLQGQETQLHCRVYKRWHLEGNYQENGESRPSTSCSVFIVHRVS